ncbi:MAG: sodium:solute symporter [Limisphaerales bacterium]
MSPWLILGCVAAYFAVLVGIAWWTGRTADDAGYYLGNRQSPWWIVAFGLIGDSLSGVTYLSVPGQVSKDGWSYLQVVFGYVLGYMVIAHVLTPMYYRLGLTSIYTYLGQRFDRNAEWTGSAFFLVSRLLGSAARLYLAITVFQSFVFDPLGVPFWLAVTGVIGLILAYTWRGGIKTLVWTDTFQSVFLVLGVLVSIGVVARELDWGPIDLLRNITASPMSRVFIWDWRAPDNFWKQLLSGAAIAVVMTGLDQNNMQKSLSCQSLRACQKNFYLFTVIMVAVNACILSLGILLLRFAEARGIVVPEQTDQLFPTLALGHFGTAAGLVFLIGLTAATFNSADSVLTTLTTSFCMDFMGFERRSDLDAARRESIRHWTHLGFALLLWATILVFKALNQGSVIKLVLQLAGYTYGPLLGLFALGLLTRQRVGGPWIAIVAMVSPILCAILSANSARWLDGYVFGFELLILNGLLVAAGALLLGRRDAHPH